MAPANSTMISGGNADINIHGGIFNQTNQTLVVTSRGFDLLAKNVATKARHDSGEVSDPIKCHPDTRIAILTDLEEWAEGTTYNYPIKWLTGSVGVGKTTIMRTTAETLQRKKLLLAGFFFWRTGDRCNNADFLIATIAYQIAISIPQTRQYIERAIDENPLIFTQTLEAQSRVLIIDPLIFAHEQETLPLHHPRIVIVDGLDECQDSQKQSDVLRILHWILLQLPTAFALLIASRPENHIRGIFNTALKEVTSSIVLDDSCNPDADIERFYLDKFREIRGYHSLRLYLPTSNWPSRDIIDTLVKKASGQFIYASTVVKFVGAGRKNPSHQLEIVLDAKMHGNATAFQSLDALYSIVFSTIGQEELPDTLLILGVLLIEREFSVWPLRLLDFFLELRPGEVRRLLIGLESLLSVRETEEELEERICFYHASLEDYLFDSSRSGPFSIDESVIFERLAKSCIRHLFILDDVIQEYIRSKIRNTLERAKPTADLHCAIELGGMLGGRKFSDVSPSVLKWTYPGFLEGIMKSEIQGKERLYALKLSAYEMHMSHRLQLYFQKEELAFLAHLSSIISIDGYFLDFIKQIRPLSVESEQIDKGEGFYFYSEQSAATITLPIELFVDTADRITIEMAEAGRWFSVTALYLLRCMCPSSRFYIESTCSGGRDRRSKIIAMIFPRMLSRASTKSTLGEYLTNNEISASYSEFPGIEDAIDQYLLRDQNSQIIQQPEITEKSKFPWRSKIPEQPLSQLAGQFQISEGKRTGGSWFSRALYSLRKFGRNGKNTERIWRKAVDYGRG